MLMDPKDVRRIRKGLRWTQAELARVLRCSPQTVMRAEQRGCDGIMMAALCALRDGWRPGGG